MKTTNLIIASLLIFGSAGINYLYGQNGVNSTNATNMTWKEVSPYGAKCFIVNSKRSIFAGTYGVARSENDGESWELKDLPNTSYAVSSMAINSKDDIFVTTDEGKFYRSTNNGDFWTQLFPDSTDIFFKCIVITSSDTIFIGTENEVLRSGDNAESYEKTGFVGSVGRIFISPDDDIFIKSNTLYRSLNNGGTWTAVDTGLTNTGINGMAFDSRGHVYACTAGPDGGVFKSQDNSDHWTVTDFSFHDNYDSIATAIACDSADNVIFGTLNLGIFFIGSDGSNLTQINDGVPDYTINNVHQYDSPEAFISIAKDFMLAGFSGTILKSTQGIPTGIEGKEFYPTIFTVEQNFPNPFNSSTAIQYTLQKAMYAKVSIFDQDGRVIETLIDQYQLQGDHIVTWYAAGCNPGVYFYEIEANGFKIIKKMILIK